MNTLKEFKSRVPPPMLRYCVYIEVEGHEVELVKTK